MPIGNRGTTALTALAAALVLSTMACAGPSTSRTAANERPVQGGSVAQGRPEGTDVGAKPKEGHDKRFDYDEVPDPAKYRALKAEAQRKKGQPAPPPTDPVPLTTSPNPSIITNKSGINDPAWNPPDWNGAVGSTRYIQVVNNRVAFSTTSLSPVSSDSTGSLAASTSVVGDPEITYDPGTNKFYYAIIDHDASGYSIAYGWSKTNAPSSTADFCHYRYPFGTVLPDYPRLGGTRNFLLVGVNQFDVGGGTGYTGSSVLWARKPLSTSISTCAGSVTRGVQPFVGFTPVPVHQDDPSATGYILSTELYGGNTLHKVTVTTSSTGTAVFSAPTSVAVPSYSYAADSEQLGTSDKLGTSDPRLLQVVQAYDPRVAKTALWTAHTVFGGLGAAVRWYELDAAAGVLQTGVLSNPSVNYFNGTIAPDRAYASSTSTKFGSNMVLTFTASSPTTAASVEVVSKRGTSGVSSPVVVAGGSGAITCGDNNSVCRWGDRSSVASSLFASQANATGRVWLSNGYASGAQYASRNAQVSP